MKRLSPHRALFFSWPSPLDIGRNAASLIEVEYGVEPPQTSLEMPREKAFDPGKAKSGYDPPPSRGNADETFASAPLNVYDKTQSVLNSKTYICNVFHLKKTRSVSCRPLWVAPLDPACGPSINCFWP
jgi:hypothetical protein